MLKDVCKINMGQSPDSSSYNDDGEGIPFFQGNADFGERYPITRVWCASPTKLAEAGDILISVRAPIGALNYAKEKCCIGRGLAALTPDKSKVSLEFVYWFLKGKKAELNIKGTGSTFKAIGRKVLEEIKLPNIDFNKQHEYAEILERTYAIIQKRNNELRLLDNLIKARFVEMFGDPVKMITAGKTELVENLTDEVAVGFVGESTNEYVDNGIPYLRMQNIRPMKVISDNLIYIKEEFHKRIRKAHVFTDDVVISRVGINRGMTAVIPSEYNNSSIGNAVIIRKSEKFNSVFLSAYITYAYGKHTSIGYSKGSAQGAISVGLVKKWPIIKANISLQNEFADFVNQVNKSKVVVQKALDETQKLFDSLMQQYFG